MDKFFRYNGPKGPTLAVFAFFYYFLRLPISFWFPNQNSIQTIIVSSRKEFSTKITWFLLFFNRLNNFSTSFCQNNVFSGRFIFTKVFIEPKRSEFFCSFFSQNVGLHMLIWKMEQKLGINTYIFRHNGRNGLTWAIYVCFLMISFHYTATNLMQFLLNW